MLRMPAAVDRHWGCPVAPQQLGRVLGNGVTETTGAPIGRPANDQARCRAEGAG